MSKRTAVGIVAGDKTRKTRRVEIARLVQDPKYGKFVRKRTICYVHDEGDESHKGDTVEIEECRPMSRTKRWKLLRIVEKSRFSGITTVIEESEDALDLAEAGLGGEPAT
jgi:small subunit ribosomal protein S17